MTQILDTHLHLVYADRFSYPWLAGVPTINKPWSVESYFQEALPLGIEAALHMEMGVVESQAVAETEFVLGLPRIVGAIAACQPESVEFAAHIDRLAKLDRVKGVRRILHEAPDDLSQSDLFRQNIRLLAGYGLSYDLCVRADQLPIGRALAEVSPEVTFILDHCGIPDVKGGKLDPWREHIREIARLPNVNAKISGVVAYAGEDWTVESLRPFVEHVIEQFGWDRVVWASDHPVVTLTGSLTRWVEATREIIKGATSEEQEKLLNGNARRIYRLRSSS